MSIFDRLLNLRPRGLPASNITIPDTSFRQTVSGIETSERVHPVNPYKPNVGGGASPSVKLHPQFVPPNRRGGGLPAQSMGLALGHMIAPGQSVRKGIDHPGRRLGRTGNPNVGVPGQR